MLIPGNLTTRYCDRKALHSTVVSNIHKIIILHLKTAFQLTFRVYVCDCLIQLLIQLSLFRHTFPVRSESQER